MRENITAQKPKNKIRKDVLRRYGFLISLFALPVLNFLVFWLYLNFSALDFSFKVELPTGEVVYSLANFKTLFERISMPGSVFWIALKNTLLYWFTNSILSYAVALFVGFFLYKKILGAGVYKFIFYMPNLIAPTVLVALFKQIIANNGFFGLFYSDLSAVPNLLSDEKYAIWTCLFYSFFFGFGTNLLIISGSMSQVDSSVVEAGKLDGVNIWQEMLLIVIPIIWPTVIANMISSIAGIFNSSGPILLLTNGNAKTTTINFWIYQNVYGISGTGAGANYYLGSAIGTFFALIAIPLTFLSRKLLQRVVPSNDDGKEE